MGDGSSRAAAIAPPGTGSAGRQDHGSPHADLVSLWEWRRVTAELYAEIRALDPVMGWHRWRTVRDHLFRHHSQSPIAPHRRATFAGLSYFAYEPSLRLTVELAEPGEIATATVGAGQDGEMRLLPFARTHGLRSAVGTELTLFWIEGYGGGVFLPFRDPTNGGESFGGGRYLLDTIKGADLGWTQDGKIVLDFNFAYNPSCSYSDRWVCPLAPPENRLRQPIRAGERV